MRPPSFSAAAEPPGHGTIAAVAGIAAAAFVSPALFGGEVPVWRDFLNVFLPHRLHAARALAAGELATWAPEPGFGVAFFASWQTAVLHPLALPLAVLPVPAGIGVFLALHFVIAAVGTSLLLGRLGLAPGARLFGAVTYAFGGTLVSSAAWGHFTVAAVLPLALFAADRLGERPTRTAFAGLAALFALALLAGAPESFAQLLLLAALLGVARSGVRALVPVGTATLLALGVTAVQLLPALEAFLLSDRPGGLGRDLALRHSLEPVTLATLVAPRLLANGILPSFAEADLPLFWSIYVGLVPLAAALAAVATRRARPWVLLLAVSLVLALGRHTPVLPWLHDLVPALAGLVRYPQKLLVTVHLALSVLAAIGADGISGRVGVPTRVGPPHRLGAPRRLALAVALAGLAFADLWRVHRPALVFTDWQSLRDAAAAPGLPGTGLHPRVFHYERRGAGLERLDPKLTVGGDVRAWARRTWSERAANTGLLYGIGFAGEAGGLRTRDLGLLAERLEQAPVEEGVRILEALGVGTLVGEDPLPLPGATRVRRGGEERAWIYRLPRPAPRTWVAGRVTTAAGESEALARLGAPGFEPGVDAVVEGPPGLAERLGIDRGARSPGIARLVASAPTSLRIAVATETPALVVAGDAFDPGWLVAVDGAPAAALRVNGILRGVVVRAGEHEVTWTYDPPALRRGAWISGTSLVLLAGLAILPRRGGRPS